MISSKERAELRAKANRIETIVHIGKGGITESVIKQADEALDARELVKVGLLETAPVEVREAAEDFAAKLGAEVIQCIGKRFTIYRKKAE